MSKVFKITVLVVLIAILIPACQEKKEEKEKPNSKLTTVTISKVSQKLVKDEIQITGTIYPNEEVIISNEKEGKITKLLVDLGDFVKKGQLLAQIDPVDYSLEFNESQARLEATRSALEGLDNTVKSLDEHSIVMQAKANLDEAELRMKRLKDLAAQKLVPLQDYDTAQSKYLASKAVYENAKTSVTKLKNDYKAMIAQNKISAKTVIDTKITAPMSGYIQQRSVTLGEYLKPNTQMMLLVQTNPLKIKAAIPEKYTTEIKKSQRVFFKVDAYNNRSFEGIITRIAPAVDIKTRTFEIEITVNNSNNLLKPGLFTKLTIDLGKFHNAIFVPDTAIYSIVGENKLFTYHNGKVKQHLIKLGTQFDNKIEVINKLNSDDYVVTSNLDQLTDGASVKVIDEKNNKGNK